VAGSPGDRLPLSPRFSGNLAIRQEFALTSATTAFFGGVVNYVGDRINIFEKEGVARLRFPGYFKTDLNAGVRTGAWTANLYANNVADRRGVLSGSQANDLFPYAYIYIPPRTVGLSVSKTF
jgi:hypothetical protein